ncbi:uncharacterized protein HD556DRAFT_1210425, partial [Suillus plorans]
LCIWLITHLFACPEYYPIGKEAPPFHRLCQHCAPGITSTPIQLPLMSKAPSFRRIALPHTKLQSSINFAAPTTWASLGHHLFISTFMLASKVICDDTYSNKSWS